MFITEAKLISVDVFGPTSQTQRPDSLVAIEKGWSIVGVVPSGRESWLVVQRRRWFWQHPSVKAAALARRVAFSQ
jgi:hypothetical protein